MKKSKYVVSKLNRITEVLFELGTATLSVTVIAVALKVAVMIWQPQEVTPIGAYQVESWEYRYNPISTN